MPAGLFPDGKRVSSGPGVGPAPAWPRGGPLAALLGRAATKPANPERGHVVLDSGCGYSWSTEWLFRSGYDAIGVDICRTYLEIAVQRLGTFRPHLIVGDVENLPLQGGTANAVLAYESFHHIPNRN